MLKRFKRFSSEDDGAVTVDWVVLTAAITVLAASGYLAVQTGVNSLSASISAGVADETVN